MAEYTSKTGETFDEIFEPYHEGTTKANTTSIKIRNVDLNERYLKWDGFNTTNETGYKAKKNPSDTTLTDLNLIFCKKLFVEIGTVVVWSSPSIPPSYLLCDGTSYSTSTYSNLFLVIGYTYGGSGDNFNVPNFTNYRMPYYTTGTAFGSSGGSESVVVNSNNVPTHTHDVGNIQGASHTHNIGYDQNWTSSVNNSGRAGGEGNANRTVNGDNNGILPGISAANVNFQGISDVNSGNSSYNWNILNPYLGVYYIIKC